MIAASTVGGENGHVKLLSPGEIAKAITGRDYLSYSQVSLFQACTLKWYFTYVAKVEPEMIAAALLMGSSVHAAIQHHLECQLAAETQPSLDQLMVVFHQNWKEQAGATPVEFSREENTKTQAEMARRMLESFRASPYSLVKGQTLGIEETLRVSLDRALPDLLAKVDLIEAVDHQLVVTDFKTARSMWNRDTAEEHAEQLHLYAEAVQTIAEDFQVPVKLRFVILTKAKSPRVESIDIKAEPSRVQRSIEIIKSVFNAMQTGVVYPSPSTMNCIGCPFKIRCKSWHKKSRVKT